MASGTIPCGGLTFNSTYVVILHPASLSGATPDLDHDVTQGIQSQNLERGLGR